MTAFVMIRCADRILTAADGAMYLMDGAVAGFGSKILTLTGLNAIITCSGPTILLRIINLMLIGKTNSLDTLLDELTDIVKRAYREADNEVQLPPFYIALGGYSAERQRFESYYMRSIPREETGPFSLPGEAWQIMPAPEVLGMPWPDAEAEQTVGLQAGQGQIDPYALAVKFLAGARLTRSDGSHGEPAGFSLVGGFMEVAEVGLDWTHTSIVHRWPDRLNELIDPANGDLMPHAFRDRPVFLPIVHPPE